MAFKPAKHREAPGCCFASVFVPLSDENRDGDRSSNQETYPDAEPTPFPASGPHSPSKVGNARAPMRVFPALRKKRAIPGTCLAGRLHLALEISPPVRTVLICRAEVWT